MIAIIVDRYMDKAIRRLVMPQMRKVDMINQIRIEDIQWQIHRQRPCIELVGRFRDAVITVGTTYSAALAMKRSWVELLKQEGVSEIRHHLGISDPLPADCIRVRSNGHNTSRISGER